MSNSNASNASNATEVEIIGRTPVGQDLPTGALSHEKLHRVAPSVFAETAFSGMSSRYKFVPTITVVDWMHEMGFYPVSAMQSRTRIEGKREFTRHVVRFRHRDLMTGANVGDELPEVVVGNSHDGSSGYQLSGGIFRMACTNGLHVQSSNLGSISVRHTGGADFHDKIAEATNSIGRMLPNVMERVEGWKMIELRRDVQEAFAEAALELRDSTLAIPPSEVLRPRRSVDQSPDLWTTFNRIQENLIKGGPRGVSETTGRRRASKAVTGVDADTKLNRALWTLTERLAEIAGPNRVQG